MRELKGLFFYKQKIEDLGGVCLSTDYINSKTKISVSCKEHHVFLIRPNDIQTGYWCKKCGLRESGIKRRKDLSYLTEMARSKYGKCLSVEYKGMVNLHEWECDEGHIWMAKANGIQQGQWCPYCSKNSKKDIKYCKALAEAQNGKLINSVYAGVHSKYTWECENKHRWTNTASHIAGGQWCPVCFGRRSRKELRILETVKMYVPDAVGSVAGMLDSPGLELDVFSPSLCKALEFDGTYWHTSQWAIDHGSLERDNRKTYECQKKGIKLIRISEAEFDTNTDSVFEKIKMFFLVNS